MTEAWRVEVEDGIATVLIDCPGEAVNTLSPSIISELDAIVSRLETDPGVVGVVLASAKTDSFVAGADVRLFDEMTDPDSAAAALAAGQEAFDRLERLHSEHGKPVVAAIHGACLGGGLELALACSGRIATDHPQTRFGQPEVRLGVIPAGGGTQRLPSLVGLAASLGLILSGRTVSVSRARRLGLVDEVVAPGVEWEAARETASRAPRSRGPGLRRRAAAGPGIRRVMFARARRRIETETRGNYPAPERALAAVRIGIEAGRAEGLAAERRLFSELVTTSQSRALRSLFFATRQVARQAWAPDGVAAAPIEHVGVLGGGLMGAGIAAVTTLEAGATVRVREVDATGIGRALAQVREVVEARRERRRLTSFEATRALLRVTGTSDWSGFAGAGLVIEAVYEDLDLKRLVLAEAERAVAGEAVLASNTSSLPISALAEALVEPDRLVGMHYFSPVDRMALLEVVATEHTSPSALATALALGRRQGKTVVVVNDGPGFYTTRILAPYTTEAFHLLAEGVPVEGIDEAMVAWGFPLGPLLLADEVGIDVGVKIAGVLVEAFGERMRPPGLAEGLARDDRRGRKNRRGFYRYDAAGVRGGVDPSVYDSLGAEPSRSVARSEIQERLAWAMVNEAARCLDEGILRSARDGDVATVLGLGFPPFRGGPFWLIDDTGPATVVACLEELAGRHGSRFEPADILRRAAAEGESFRSG